MIITLTHTDTPDVDRPDADVTRRRWLERQDQALQDAARHLARTPGVAAVHATRVAARRLRAVLSAWRPHLHPVLAAELNFELRNLGRQLAGVREADVMRQLAAQLLARSDATLVPARNALLATLDRRRAGARQQFRQARRQPAWGGRLQRLHALLTDERLVGLARPGESLTIEMDTLQQQLRKLTKALARKQLDLADLHRLRIRGKKLRYRAEMLTDSATGDLQNELRWLRRTQSVLGDIHDRALLQARLSELTPSAELRREIERCCGELERRHAVQLAGLRRMLRKR